MDWLFNGQIPIKCAIVDLAGCDTRSTLYITLDRSQTTNHLFPFYSFFLLAQLLIVSSAKRWKSCENEKGRKIFRPVRLVKRLWHTKLSIRILIYLVKKEQVTSKSFYSFSDAELQIMFSEYVAVPSTTGRLIMQLLSPEKIVISIIIIITTPWWELEEILGKYTGTFLLSLHLASIFGVW